MVKRKEDTLFNKAEARSEARIKRAKGRKVRIVRKGKGEFVVIDAGKRTRRIGIKRLEKTERVTRFLEGGVGGIRISKPKTITRIQLQSRLSDRRKATALRVLNSNASIAAKLRAQKILNGNGS